MSIIENSWTVVLKHGITVAEFETHLCMIRARARPSAVPAIKHIYQIGNLKGYAGIFRRDIIEFIRRHPAVHYVEPNKRIRAKTLVNEKPTRRNLWNLGSISHRSGTDHDYIYDNGGLHKAFVFVLDTGVRTTHEDFSGRAHQGWNAFGTAWGNGAEHGTHVAGIIAGSTSGVAKTAEIIAVRVMDDYGNGTTDDLIAGIVWAAESVRTRSMRYGQTVINISINGDVHYPLNAVINEAVGLGMTVVVSAGNCSEANNNSPASAHGAITVGATQMVQIPNGSLEIHRATDSNFGGVVNIFAPGTDISSCGIESDRSYVVLSGTSMAAPHVTGVAAYLISHGGNKSSPTEVTRLILSNATQDLIEDLGDHSVNLYLHNGSEVQ